MMKNTHWKWVLSSMAVCFLLSCGSGGGSQHLNDNPRDLGMPDSPTISDSPMAGQPSGYAPAGSGKKTDSAAIDSATKGQFQ